MKLLVIYGPPASGKLTVANEIIKVSKFKLFHNHKSIDVYEDILGYGTEEFWEKVNKLRFDIFELAAKKNINLIFTVCYESSDKEYIEKIEKIIKKNNGSIYFVQLAPPKDVLFKRVIEESRKNFGKIKTIESLTEDLEKNDYYTPFKHINSITIDNSNKPASEVAKEIINYFKF